jgi:hypothetical protein
MVDTNSSEWGRIGWGVSDSLVNENQANKTRREYEKWHASA